MNKIETVLKNADQLYNQKEKEGCAPDRKEYTRRFMKILPQLDLDNEEIKQGFCTCVKMPFSTRWKALKAKIYEVYMLDIGEEENPTCVDSFGCWLNLTSMQIGTKKPYDPFSEDECCVWIEDFRKIDESISWLDLVEE